MLSEKIIKEQLSSRFSNAEVLVFDTVNSTNLVAKEKFIADAENPLIVVSNSQTAGRGRMGRNFYSPEDTGIYLSIAVNAKNIPNILSATAKTAVGVCRTLEELGINPKIKWVNDIYINSKKACGILAEGILCDTNNSINGMVIGIGVNVSTNNFPKELENIATSLGITTDRNKIIASIVNNVLSVVLSESDDFIHEYKDKSLVLGKEITCISATENFSATAVDIDNNGALIVKIKGGTLKTISTGEVSVRL